MIFIMKKLMIIMNSDTEFPTVLQKKSLTSMSMYLLYSNQHYKI